MLEGEFFRREKVTRASLSRDAERAKGTMRRPGTAVLRTGPFPLHRMNN